MKNTKLTNVTQSVNGGKNNYKEVGYALLTIQEDGRNEIDISVDTFEGYGKEYKRREQAEIKISYSYKGEHHDWHGTPDDLKQLLYNPDAVNA